MQKLDTKQIEKQIAMLISLRAESNSKQDQNTYNDLLTKLYDTKNRIQKEYKQRLDNKKFIENELVDICQKLNSNVLTLCYFYIKELKKDFVLAIYSNGESKQINIKNQNLNEIILTVIKEI